MLATPPQATTLSRRRWRPQRGAHSPRPRVGWSVELKTAVSWKSSRGSFGSFLQAPGFCEIILSPPGRVHSVFPLPWKDWKNRAALYLQATRDTQSLAQMFALLVVFVSLPASSCQWFAARKSQGCNRCSTRRSCVREPPLSHPSPQRQEDPLVRPRLEGPRRGLEESPQPGRGSTALGRGFSQGSNPPRSLLETPARCFREGAVWGALWEGDRGEAVPPSALELCGAGDFCALPL